jgi:hypothetical protein
MAPAGSRKPVKRARGVLYIRSIFAENPLPDIGAVALGVGELAAAGKDHLRCLGGELVPGIRSARLAHSNPQRRDVPGQPAACGEGLEGALVEPQLGDVAWVLFELAALDLLDDVYKPLVGARLNADLLALAHDKAV